MLIDQLLIENKVETIEPIIKGWQECFPDCGVLILLPESEKNTLPSLQALFRSRHIPLLGAIFPALLSEQGFSTSGICLIGFKQRPAHFLLPDLQEQGGKRIGKATLELLKTIDKKGELPTLFLIFDSMLPNIASMLNELHTTIGTRTSCAGVNAGSETFQAMPCLFDSDNLIGNGVLGLLLEGKTGVAVKHGYPVSKSLMNATSTAGNRIDTINNRPAFEVYQEVIQAEYGVSLNRDNFYDHAVHFPFGLVTVLDVLVRIPVAFTEEGALFCVGEVPPNTLLKLLRAPDFESSRCIGEIAHALSNPLDAPLLTFYCAGRRMHFGTQASEELGQLHKMTGASHLFGALTLGEIDCIEELNLLPRFHNAALVCVKL